MNCFPLDDNMAISAQYHNDRHVVKIILEGVQMLSTANTIHGLIGCYKPCHVYHPMTQWVAKSAANYMWMRNYVIQLNIEWKYRFDHISDHKSIIAMSNMTIWHNSNDTITEMPRCMPANCFRKETGYIPVQSYRNYYQTSKQHLAKWTKRPIPDWYNYTGINTIETRKLNNG